MFATKTLFGYLARQYLKSLMLITSIIASVIILVDSLELIRRSYGKLLLIEKIFFIVLMRLPYTLQEILPFICLIASMVSYGKLSRNNELVIMRSIGISSWQFMFPSLVTSFAIGIIYIFMLTPITSKMFYRAEIIEDRILRGHSTSASALISGIWLKDYISEEGNIIINAKNISPQAHELREVTFIISDKNFKLVKRIDADIARLEDGYWIINNAMISTTNKINKLQPLIKIRSSLNIDKLQESFNKPSNLSFWQLPSFIITMKKTGLPAVRHSHYFWSLIALPFLLSSMTLLAGGFASKLNKRMQNNIEIFWGIITSFIIYFINQIITTLGLAATIPLTLSIISPIIIAFSVALLLIIHKEDT